MNLEDVRKAVKKGKASRVDWITSEKLRLGGEGVLEWLTSVCKIMFD